MPREEIVRLLGMPTPTTKRRLRLRRQAGDVEPKPVPGPRPERARHFGRCWQLRRPGATPTSPSQSTAITSRSKKGCESRPPRWVERVLAPPRIRTPPWSRRPPTARHGPIPEDPMLAKSVVCSCRGPAPPWVPWRAAVQVRRSSRTRPRTRAACGRIPAARSRQAAQTSSSHSEAAIVFACRSTRACGLRGSSSRL